MASTAPISEPAWSTPATKGDLILLQTSLEGKIQDAQTASAAKISDLRVEMVNMDRRLSGEIADLRTEMAGLRVSMAWMTVGVVTILGGLITLFEFIA